MKFTYSIVALYALLSTSAVFSVPINTDSRSPSRSPILVERSGPFRQKFGQEARSQTIGKIADIIKDQITSDSKDKNTNPSPQQRPRPAVLTNPTAGSSSFSGQFNRNAQNTAVESKVVFESIKNTQTQAKNPVSSSHTPQQAAGGSANHNAANASGAAAPANQDAAAGGSSVPTTQNTAAGSSSAPASHNAAAGSSSTSTSTTRRRSLEVRAERAYQREYVRDLVNAFKREVAMNKRGRRRVGSNGSD